MAMRFGLQIETYPSGPTGNEFDTMLAVARLAEEVGYDSLWYEDHFMWRDGSEPPGPSPQLECLTTLAAIAMATTRVELGMLVLGAPYRNPALVAKMLATLDLISHGRVIAGLGAGWHEQEFDAYGWSFQSTGERLDRLEEAIQVVDALLTTRPASFHGRYYELDRALNDPPPVRRPRPPLLIGGNGERRTLRLVARYADLCNVYGSVDEVARKYAALRRHCADVGRSYEAITRTINHWTVLARDEAERAEKSARFPDITVVTPDEAVSELRRYEAIGTEYVIVKILDAADLSPVQRFAEEIFPTFVG
jgi:F420-dependent oxidoreductase-like protein